jgi:hypothetical protein
MRLVRHAERTRNMRNAYRNLKGYPKERYHLVFPSLNYRIILELILNYTVSEMKAADKYME